MGNIALKRYIDREVAGAIRREDALRRKSREDALRRKKRQDGFIDAAKDKLVSLLSRAKDSINPVDSFSAKLKKALVKAIAYAIRGGFIGFFEAGRILEKIRNRLAVSKESSHILVSKLVASASKVVNAVLSKVKRGDDSASRLMAQKRDAALKQQIRKYIDKQVVIAIRRKNDGILDKIKEKTLSAIKSAIAKLNPKEDGAAKAKKVLLNGLKAIKNGGAKRLGSVINFFQKHEKELLGLHILALLQGYWSKLRSVSANGDI